MAAHPLSATAVKSRPEQHIKKVWTIPGTDSPKLTMYGHSRAMGGTAFYIPELKWHLDAGNSNLPGSTHVWVTHGHQDHAMVLPGCAAYYVMTKMPAQIYCPEELQGFVERYVRGGLEMNFCSAITKEGAREAHCPEPYASRDFPWPVDIHGLRAGVSQPVCVPGKPGKAIKQKFHVQTFDCDHSVPTIGYGFYKESSRLKAEYAGVAPKELGKLRKAGTAITEVVRKRVFAFLGDTSEAVFEPERNPDLLLYPVIIVECTFLLPEHAGDAESRKHCHWLGLEPIIRAHPETTFVLIHFSLRYTDAEVVAFFEAMGEDRPNNIHPWVCTAEEAALLAEAAVGTAEDAERSLERSEAAGRATGAAAAGGAGGTAGTTNSAEIKAP